jgi:uncharacterized phiE125 gp8 family phage protein
VNNWRDPYSAPLQPLFTPVLLGPTELLTAPSGPLITLAEAKAHLRVDINDDDAYIADLVTDAAEFCEKLVPCSRQWLSAAYQVRVSGGVADYFGVGFWSGALRLPRPPLQAVTQVTYYDTGGNLQTLSPSVYLVKTPWRQPGMIERAPSQSWPSVQGDRREPVTIQFVAGYGPSTAVAANIAAGTQTVTPASMFGIYVGTQLVIDTGLNREIVAVTAVTSSTFTALFAGGQGGAAHTGPVSVVGNIPRTARRAVLMLVGHWYQNREGVSTAPGIVPAEIQMGVEALLEAEDYGGYG